MFDQSAISYQSSVKDSK